MQTIDYAGTRKQLRAALDTAHAEYEGAITYARLDPDQRPIVARMREEVDRLADAIADLDAQERLHDNRRAAEAAARTHSHQDTAA